MDYILNCFPLLRTAIVGLLFVHVVNAAPFANPNTLEDCEACCNAVDDGTFTLSFCLLQGCNSFVDINGVVVPGQTQFSFDCDDISADTNNNDRKGCEAGRDFKLIGASEMIDTNTQYCINGIIEPNNVPNGAPSPSPVADCTSCCNNLNDQLDNGRSNFPFANDFFVGACRDGCEPIPDCNGFRELPDHQRRLGCALGRDFKGISQTNLRNIAVACESDGTITLTTLSPTSSPSTLAPTSSPTLSPNTLAPTMSPVVFPTESTGDQDETASPVVESENGNPQQLVAIIGGSVAGGIFIVASIVLVRKRMCSASGLTTVKVEDTSWMEKIYGRTLTTMPNSFGTPPPPKLRDSVW